MEVLEYLTFANFLFFFLALLGCLAVLFLMRLAMVKGRPSKTAVFLVAFPSIIALIVITANVLSVELYPAGIMFLVAFQSAFFAANRLKVFPKLPLQPQAFKPSTNEPQSDPLIRTISES